MDEYTKDLYTMMFSLQTLQNQGITIRETVYKSLDKLLLWNKESENSKYLELALLHMQAYANMGFALDEENKTIREILKKTGKTREDFFPKGYLLGKRIKLGFIAFTLHTLQLIDYTFGPSNCFFYLSFCIIDPVLDHPVHNKSIKKIIRKRKKISSIDIQVTCHIYIV